MKKLLLTTLAVLLSLSLFGRPRELNPKIIDKEVTDWILDQLRDAGYTVLPEVIVQDTLNHKKQSKKEFDDLYYQPSKDGKIAKHHKRPDVYAIVDTLVKENPDIQVNTHYNDDPFFYSNRIGMFYHGGFNYWHYNPFFYDPWYDFDFGWGWNPYYGYNYPYWSYPYHNNFYFGWNNYYGWNFGWNMYRPFYGHNNWYGQHNNFYSHNNWNGDNFQRPEYGRRERPSNLTNNQIDNRRVQPQQRREVTSQQRINPQDKPMYQQNRRSYTPSYENPRLSTRPAFNNSKTMDMNRGRNMGNMDMNKNMGNMSNMGNRRTETSTQSRTYQPQPNKNYNTPSRNYSPPVQNRNSEPQGFGRTFNFNSGGSDRRSSGSNVSSGSNSSSSSGSSGGRSSGGSVSTGRR